jgi:hypothetical protein
VLGAFVGLTGYTLLLCAQTFWQATLSQGIIGVAVALNSGTNTAILYDTLLEEGREDEYRRLEGKRHALGIYGCAVAILAGALLFKIDPKLPAFLDVLVIATGMIVISMVREPARHTRSPEKRVFRDMGQTIKYALSGHPEITGIILVSAVILCATKLMMWTQQPYYTLLGIPVEWFGVIMASSYVVSGIVGHFSHKIEHWGSNRAVMTCMAVILTGACLVLALYPSAILAVPLFLTGTLAWAMGQPRINNAINSRVGSERRATVLSTASLMVHLLFIPTSVIVGAVSDRSGVQAGLLWIGGQIFVLSSIGLWLWSRNTKFQTASSSSTGT